MYTHTKRQHEEFVAKRYDQPPPKPPAKVHSELDDITRQVLNLRHDGYTARDIASLVKKTDGTSYVPNGIEAMIRRARDRGDPRAAPRINRGRTPSKIIGALKERMLNLWNEGHTALQIAARVLKTDGTCYKKQSVEGVIYDARDQGDPRARARRKPGRPFKNASAVRPVRPAPLVNLDDRA